ncbi:hypothetical protein LCGC14_0384570 [marine sediment metagenome]|uniref:N-acetyltransferase domain-containing protein n=1 Tax=marine sediment metagenome TaxID=412755 RepID=A0A0F9WAC3_9ZZZZ
MIIRPAVTTDIDQLVVMSEKFYITAHLDEVGLGRRNESVADYIKMMLPLDLFAIFVAIEAGWIRGTISGIRYPWLMDMSQVLLMENWWWVDPDYRGSGMQKRLEAELIAWGKEGGASRLIMVVSEGLTKKDALRRYYGRKGFEPMETHYIREI